jgi:hypothetical protein
MIASVAQDTAIDCMYTYNDTDRDINFMKDLPKDNKDDVSVINVVEICKGNYKIDAELIWDWLRIASMESLDRT